MLRAKTDVAYRYFLGLIARQLSVQQRDCPQKECKHKKGQEETNVPLVRCFHEAAPHPLNRCCPEVKGVSNSTLPNGPCPAKCRS